MEFFQSNLNLGEVFVQLLAFTIVFLALKSVAWKPLLKLLDERREKIRTGFEEIEQAKQDIERLKTDYEHARAHIEEEARKKLQEALDEGKRVAREIQESARRESRVILEKSKADLQLEMAKAKVTLRNEIADLTIRATERLIAEKLDETKDKELVLDLIEDLEKLK